MEKVEIECHWAIGTDRLLRVGKTEKVACLAGAEDAKALMVM